MNESKKARGEELYGKPPRLRVKWSCKRCSKRNDNPVPWPPSNTELFTCHGCKKPTTLHFKTETTPAPSPPTIESVEPLEPTP